MEARRCFGCHSSGAAGSAAFVLESLTPGVQCSQCHIGAAQHAADASRGASAPMPKLAAREAEELANLCTRCHPSWADIAANGPRGVANVRYPFYRLTNSRCYDTADTRITCAACHDAHGRLAKESASYDSKCQQYHSSDTWASEFLLCRRGIASPAICPRLSCPVAPQITDHRMRIVRAGDKYPN